MGQPALPSHCTPYKGESVLRPDISTTRKGWRVEAVCIVHPPEHGRGRAGENTKLTAPDGLPGRSHKPGPAPLHSGVRRDPVYSTRYGRQRTLMSVQVYVALSGHRFAPNHLFGARGTGCPCVAQLVLPMTSSGLWHLQPGERNPAWCPNLGILGAFPFEQRQKRQKDCLHFSI